VSVPVQLILKGLAGGIFVVAFALVGSIVNPTRLAGLFSAAPSVAIASLLITTYSVGTNEARQDARSMILGAVALIVAAVLGLPLLGRISAFRTATCIAGFWIVVAGIGYVAVLR
jgi:hypothetical protein